MLFKDLIIKYGNEKTFEVSKDEEFEARIEFVRQRQFLEQSIINLKKRVKTCTKKKNSYGKIMEENMLLIKEINKLRQELKINCKKYNNLEFTFKTIGNKNLTSKQFKSKDLIKKKLHKNTNQSIILI